MTMYSFNDLNLIPISLFSNETLGFNRKVLYVSNIMLCAVLEIHIFKENTSVINNTEII